MLSDVMNHYGLVRDFPNTGFDAGYFETEHLDQLFKNICSAIHSGGLIALTGPLGSGKTVTLLRIRRMLKEDKDGKVRVARSLAVDKERVTLGLLIDALFYDLTSKKEIKIPTRGERRERELQGLFKQARRPVALFVDDAHRLNWNTLRGLKRLIEVMRDGGGTLAIILAGQPKLRNELLKPTLEEVGYRATIFTLYGIRDSKREYIEWLLNLCTKRGVKPKDVMQPDAIDLLAERFSTALEIESGLTRSLEAAYLIGEKPVTTQVVETIVPPAVTDWQATLIRNGYDLKDLAVLLTAKPQEIKLLLRGQLEPARMEELRVQMRSAGLPVPDVGEAEEVSEEQDNKGGQKATSR